MKLEFQSKHPHRSRFLVIISPKEDGAKVNPILAEFASEGWQHSLSRVPNKTHDEWVLTKNGSGLFHSWTTAEQKVFRKEAEKILKTFGIKNVPYRKLTIQDCI